MCAGGASRASAQAPWTASGHVALIEHRVDAGFGAERFRGLGLGLQLQRRVGSRLTLQLAGQGAELQAAASGDLDRRVGDADLRAHVAVGPSWGFYTGLTLRAVASDAARQRWVFGRVGAEVRPAFSGDRLTAVGRLGLIPVTTVSGLASASFGLDGAVGLDYHHDRVTVGLLYGLERFGFPASNGVRRAEQVSSLTLRGGIRL
jgi:hypothetical protein